MPQPGIHGIFALATRNTFSTQPWFALGLTFGALTPDVDRYAQAFAVVLGKMDPVRADELFHRTLTHSLFTACTVGLAFYLLSFVRGGQALRTFGWGVVVGMVVLHSFADIFAWFDGVGILWPFWSINLWAWVTLPEIIKNLLRAGSFLAFAGYFAYFVLLARRTQTNAAYLPRLRLYTYAQLGIGIGFTVLAFVVTTGTYNVADGLVFLFFAYPNALWVTWRMRETIEA